MRIGIVAGEPSGDALGAGLMLALRARAPEVSFVGIGGERMLEAGLHGLFPLERLTMHGFNEPLRRLPDLLRIFSQLRRRFFADQVSAFVGVDFNVFNLLLERSLKRRGLKTIHYVSPSVYAWRQGRAARIRRSTDLILTLFPFEPAIYERHGVRAEFVGHPLADELCVQPSDVARASLGLPLDGPLFALLAGSRTSEVRLMSGVFCEAAQRVRAQMPDARFLWPCVRPEHARLINASLTQAGATAYCSVLCGNARVAMAAADAVLVKSGTSTLEAMLLERPMAVAYKLGPVTYRIVKALIRTRYVALPNILAGRELVPEYLQGAATGAALADALIAAWRRPAEEWLPEYRAIAAQLRRGASANAASSVLELMRA